MLIKAVRLYVLGHLSLRRCALRVLIRGMLFARERVPPYMQASFRIKVHVDHRRQLIRIETLGDATVLRLFTQARSQEVVSLALLTNSTQMLLLLFNMPPRAV